MKPRESVVPRCDQKPEATDDPLERPSVGQNAGERGRTTERRCRTRRIWVEMTETEMTEVIEEPQCRHD